APAGITPARETATTYQSFPNTPIYIEGPSIFDRPATVKTYGNGTLFAETDYSYDLTAVTPVSNLSATTHDETNYSSTFNNRGNATTITTKCLQSCSDATSKYTFDETGQAVTKIDPCGNPSCGDMTGSNH